MGFLAPVVIKGRLLMRDLISEDVGWDDALPSSLLDEWEHWRLSLKELEHIQIPRIYTSLSFCAAANKQLFVYSDASEKAIAAVAYLYIRSEQEESQIGFVMGKAKVAPKQGHTIPRLELCAAVLAVEIATKVCDHLDLSLETVVYHTDSKIVLGYLRNETKRFCVYVCNRVARIRQSSQPKQWKYVLSEHNPADRATRSVHASKMSESRWLLGPSKLPSSDPREEPEDTDIEEMLPEATVLTTHVADSPPCLGTHRFHRFSSWKQLVKGIACLKNFLRRKHMSHCDQKIPVATYVESEDFIVKQIQKEWFQKEITCLSSNQRIPRDSSLLSLNHNLDDQRLLRVGGRLNKSELDLNLKNPVIIPGRDHVATLLVRHYHQEVKHQGRQLTEGAIRTGGLWIIGGKRLISSTIHKCVTCLKSRGQTHSQRMSDLPVDRLDQSPPFTYIGVDTFGPWTVVARRTRGGCANQKR